jgi:hypothetical protein
MQYFVKKIEGAVVSLHIFSETSSEIKPEYIEVGLTEFEAFRNSIGNLSELKKVCKNEIDAFAGDVRLRFITSSPGQAETYILKATEAKALKALGYPVFGAEEQSTYPLIHAEMIVTGNSLAETCETIIAMENLWKVIAAAVETFRLSGKRDVDAATTSGEIIIAKNIALSNLNNIE